MSTPLRVGFLVSGLLHMAVVAAISLARSSDIAPVAEETLPITLKLVAFQPPAEPVVAAEPLPPAPLVAESPPPPSPPEPSLPEPSPPPPPKPTPRAEAAPVAAPSEPAPPVVAGAAAPTRPVTAKRPRLPERPRQATVRRAVTVKHDPRPAPAAAPPAGPVIVAKTDAPKPAVPPAGVRETQHYLAALAARIDRSKYYPRASRRLGEEGMAVVGFVIQRNGELTEIHVVESSGHRRLDEAALKTLRRVTPFEKIPDAIDREQWPITVPIAFSLRG